MSSNDKIDPEVLIGLVETRPGLWDKSFETHKAHDQRSAAWRDICLILCPEYERLARNDKHMYAKTVIKKWTNIRDAWKKSVAENNKKKIKPYIYHEQLKFLEKNLRYKENSAAGDVTDSLKKAAHRSDITGDDTFDRADRSSLDDSDDASDCAQDSLTGNDGEGSSNRGTVRRRRTGELREAETGMIQFMDVRNTNQNEDNPHLCFVRGLLPMLNKLNDDETLDFQIGAIRLLQNIRKRPKLMADDAVPQYGIASSSCFGIKEDVENV